MNLGRRLLRRLPRPSPTGVGLAGAVALGIVAVVVRPRRVVVEGRSMEPTLAPGDRLLVVRARSLHAGDVVAVRDPRHPGRVLVKRIGAVLDDGVVVRGDNPGASTDSRSFGPVPSTAVLGRVFRCYAPSWRAGPVR
ncbi:MAG: nickel-type superoxide dismutase maturation protease [Acidimicrobiales bacterium]